MQAKNGKTKKKREKKLIAFPWRCKMNRNDREKESRGRERKLRGPGAAPGRWWKGEKEKRKDS